jgi:hypothetical protein
VLNLLNVFTVWLPDFSLKPFVTLLLLLLLLLLLFIYSALGPLQCHALPDLLSPTFCLPVPYLDQFYGTLPFDRTSVLLRLAGAAAKVRLDSHRGYAHGLGKG